ncbi:MAG: hypothetical protein CMJ59_16740 [Planctomycetaceae bacterium]|nr:hypothetical protein [Planctomycetaceae bacterium]
MKRLLANCLVLLLTSGLATGQRPRGSPKRLAVDVVSVKGGPQLFGAVLSRSADGGLTMAVERAWLEKTYPRYYQELAAGERALATAAREGLTRRIERWQRRRSEDANLVLFLREQAQQVAKPLDAAAATTSQFVMIELAAGEVRNVFRQPPRQRRIAELAWALRLDNVTTRTANHLQRELQKREVDVAKAPQLADRFGTLPQGEQEWAARMALVEFRLRKKLTFQGEGEYVARTGSGADKVDLNDLVNQIVGQQLGAQITDILGGDVAKRPKVEWRKKVIREAEYEGVSGFMVSRLMRDFRRTDKGFVFPDAAVVELSFFAKMPDRSWRVVWRHQEKRVARTVDPRRAEAVAAAPRVRTVMEFMKKLGLAGNEKVVDSLLAFGAATMAAQEAGNLAFGRLLLRHTQQLDGPPLTLAAAPRVKRDR